MSSNGAIDNNPLDSEPTCIIVGEGVVVCLGSQILWCKSKIIYSICSMCIILVVSNTAIELQRDDNKSTRGDLEDL